MVRWYNSLSWTACVPGRQKIIITLVNAIKIRDAKKLEALAVGVLNDFAMYFLYNVREEVIDRAT